MTELLRLAERCEAATGPDRELEEAIMDALFDRQAFVRLADAPSGTGYNSWLDESGRRTSALRYTASLDAAMTLVPEGCHFEVHSTLLGRPDDKPLAGVWWKPEGAALKSSKARATGRAATPALALCAAALRARAGETE